MSTSNLSLSTTVELAEKLHIPQLGFGVYRSPPTVTDKSVTHALQAGYRHIDTAQIYRNEKEVGKAVRQFLAASGGKVTRQDVWITTKLRDERGKLPKKLDDVPKLLRESVDVICHGPEMGGYVDLFLIHSPYAGPEGRRVQWKALEDLKREGKTRSIGVSNL
jgi:diketogulonate reductase-like aldo/keto reductase